MRRLSLTAAALSLLSACVLITGVGDLEVFPEDAGVDASAPVDVGVAIDSGVEPAVDAAEETTVMLDAGIDACTASTDISTDPLHCGVCNHDCLGAKCTFGRCGVVEIIGGLPQRGGLTIAGGKIFVSMTTAIRRFEIDGGSPIDVVNAVSPHYLAADATYLYFVDSTTSPNTIKRWPLAGGAVDD